MIGCKLFRIDLRFAVPEVIQEGVLRQEFSGCIELSNGRAEFILITRLWAGLYLTLSNIADCKGEKVCRKAN